MSAPRPVFVIVVMFVVALYSLSKGPVGSGAEAAGYLFGSIVLPALIAIAYVWWYRRRERSAS